ncbi:MAG: RNase adapter RapZ [Pseudomonadota bacterium]
MNMRFIVISGLSGAGKTIALHALEDSGFYCIDNLPVGVLAQFAEYFAEQPHDTYSGIAVGIDARSLSTELPKLPATLEALRAMAFETELVCVDASDEVLLQRFSETRRKHPLSSAERSLARAIAAERELLDAVFAAADLRIDTSSLTVHEFRHRMQDQVVRRERDDLVLQFRSFGFKRGVPLDVDFVFDVRCLPNPYWDPNLRGLTGNDRAVRDFLAREPEVNGLIEDVTGFLKKWVPRFELENRSYLTVALGCTGGRHRSVYVATEVARHFEQAGKSVLISHRDCERLADVD